MALEDLKKEKLTLKKTVMSSSIFSRVSSNIASSIKSPKITFGGIAKAIGSQPNIPELGDLKPPEESPLAGMVSELQSKYQALSKVVQNNSRKISSIGDSNGEDSLNEVNDTLNDIGNALSLDFANRIQEKEDKIALAKRSILKKRKKEKEEGIEGSDKIDKDNSFLNKAFNKVTKPAIGLFGGIIKFFATLGAAILSKGAFDWLQNPENMDKVKGVFEWLGNNWTWIAGALALGAVVVVIAQIASIIVALGLAFSALKIALVALSPLAWPIIAVAAIAAILPHISDQGLGTHERNTVKQLNEMPGGNTLENRRALIASLQAQKESIGWDIWRQKPEIDRQIHFLTTGRMEGQENRPDLYNIAHAQDPPALKAVVHDITNQIKAHYDPLIQDTSLLEGERNRLGELYRNEVKDSTAYVRASWNYLDNKLPVSWKVENGKFRPEVGFEDIPAYTTELSDGGVVFGPEGIDKVPTNLTAGEFVTNADSTKKFLPALFAQNNNAGEVWRSLEDGIRKQTANNQKQTDINAKFNEILVGFNQQLSNLTPPAQTGGSGPTSVSSRPPASPQIGGSSVSAVSKQVGSLQKSSSVSVVQLDIPSQNLDIDARSKQSEAPQTTLVKPSTTVLGDNIVPSPMDPYNSGRLSEAFDVYGIRG